MTPCKLDQGASRKHPLEQLTKQMVHITYGCKFTSDFHIKQKSRAKILTGKPTKSSHSVTVGQQQVRKNRTNHEVRIILCPCPENTQTSITFAVTYSCFDQAKYLVQLQISPKFQKGMEHKKQTLARSLHLVTHCAISPLKKKLHSASLSNPCIQGSRITDLHRKALKEHLKF